MKNSKYALMRVWTIEGDDIIFMWNHTGEILNILYPVLLSVNLNCEDNGGEVNRFHICFTERTNCGLNIHFKRNILNVILNLDK